MTQTNADTLTAWLLGVSVAGTVLAAGWSRLAAWWRGVEPNRPRPIVRYPRGVCQRCGTADVALRADGLPHARRHRCDSPRSVVTTEVSRPVCGRCPADVETCACAGSTVEVA